MRGLLCSPPFVRFICSRMWGRRVLPAALPAPLSTTLSPALSVYLRECGATGSASGRTACPIRPTLHQSQSRHGNVSPLRPGCPSLPLLLVWMNVYFLFPWCRTSLPFDFLSVLVVRGGAVCLPTPPSWFSKAKVLPIFFFLNMKRYDLMLGMSQMLSNCQFKLNVNLLSCCIYEIFFLELPQNKKIYIYMYTFYMYM